MKHYKTEHAIIAVDCNQSTNDNKIFEGLVAAGLAVENAISEKPDYPSDELLSKIAQTAFDNAASSTGYVVVACGKQNNHKDEIGKNYKAEYFFGRNCTVYYNPPRDNVLLSEILLTDGFFCHDDTFDEYERLGANRDAASKLITEFCEINKNNFEYKETDFEIIMKGNE
jgi:hypothetical protein